MMIDTALLIDVITVVSTYVYADVNAVHTAYHLLLICLYLLIEIQIHNVISNASHSYIKLHPIDIHTAPPISTLSVYIR